MTPGPPVLIVAYDPYWPRLYEIAREETVQAIGGKFVLIEHVGSTAVPGLAAKPIIDILVGVESWEESKAHVAPLVSRGWEYLGEHGIALRHYFRKSGPDGRRSHHLHMMQAYQPGWLDMALFRDYLRENPHAAAEYGELKRMLAAQHKTQRTAYQDAKAPFIRAAMNQTRNGPDRAAG